MYNETATLTPTPVESVAAVAAKPKREDAKVIQYPVPHDGRPQLYSGLYSDVPQHIYHADPAFAPSLSSSLARVLLNHSPAHVFAQHPRLNPNYAPKESSRSMNTGSLVHALLAEPEGRGAVEIGHFPDFKTAAAKAWRDEVKASGKLPILEKDFLDAQPIADALRRNAGADCTNDPFNLPEGATAYSELTAIWNEHSIYYRALFDRVVITPHTIDVWDWKTASDVSDRAIEQAVSRYNYAFQIAFYLRGLSALLPSYSPVQMSACFVFVETTAPYTVRRVFLTEDYMAHAKAQVKQTCDQWAQCILSNDFSDPRNGANFTVELPAWAAEDDDIVID